MFLALPKKNYLNSVTIKAQILNVGHQRRKHSLINGCQAVAGEVQPHRIVSYTGKKINIVLKNDDRS